MNKDLELIKECINKIHMDSMQPCIEAASRMAEDIEKLMKAHERQIEYIQYQRSHLPVKCRECDNWIPLNCKIDVGFCSIREPGADEKQNITQAEYFCGSSINNSKIDFELVNNPYKLIDELEAEIARLTAELAQRPVITTCGNCSRCYVTKITCALKCRVWNVQVNPNGYCSRASKFDKPSGDKGE